MATPKPQPTRALEVIPSPLCNIPNPALLIAEGIAVSISNGNWIECDGVINFKTIGLKAGDIVYIPGAGAATVTAILNNKIFTINVPYDRGAPSEPINLPYKLYAGNDDNQGCTLYVGTGGALTTITAGGDEAEYINVPSGMIIPVQTKMVTKVDNASNIIALW